MNKFLSIGGLLAFMVSVAPYNVAEAQSSADAFNRFLAKSPSSKAIVDKVAKEEELTSACMSSATDRHSGVTINRNGDIYTWYKDDSDTSGTLVKKLVKTDKERTDKVFNLKDTNGFSSANIDYTIDGTSYCYVISKGGSKFKQISWPKNEIMPGRQKVPDNVRAVFEAVIDTGAVAMGVKDAK